MCKYCQNDFSFTAMVLSFVAGAIIVLVIQARHIIKGFKDWDEEEKI